MFVHVVCCLLFVDSWLAFDVHCLLFVACSCSLFVVCCSLCAVVVRRRLLSDECLFLYDVCDVAVCCLMLFAVG